jgi:hypothetical protein
VVGRTRAFFFLLTLILISSGAINAANLYQEYQVAGSLAAKPAYSFGTAQYRLYSSQMLLSNDALAFEYDLDSFYLNYGVTLHRFIRTGISGKVHAFDYQNLNHIVDGNTGAENPSVSLVSRFIRGDAYVEAHAAAISLRYSLGAQKYTLAPRDKANNALTVSDPGTAFVQQVALGYWHLFNDRPYAFQGTALYLSAESQQLTAGYVWQQSGYALSQSNSSIMLYELHARHGISLFADNLRVMGALRAGATNFSLPGQPQDIVQSFSVGGPEARYRRLAGYAFSEYRVPAFGLANLDIIFPVAGPVVGWIITDLAIFDRLQNGQQVHGGAGAGLIVHLPPQLLGTRSAAFARAEVPFAAAGGNRFQVYLGLNGQII